MKPAVLAELDIVDPNRRATVRRRTSLGRRHQNRTPAELVGIYQTEAAMYTLRAGTALGSGQDLVIARELYAEAERWKTPAGQTGTIPLPPPPPSPTPGGVDVYDTFTRADAPSTSSFMVSGPTIYDPSGSVFVARGVNVAGQDWYVDRSTVGDADLICDAWGFNLIRVACNIIDEPKGPGGIWVQYTTNNDLDAIVTEFTGRGVVVLFEAHDRSGDFFDAGTEENTLEAWLTGLAETYKDNPYVWLNVMNEPDSNIATNRSPRWLALHDAMIAGIRLTGFNNPIVCDGASFGQDSAQYNTSLVSTAASAILSDGPTLVADYDNIVFSFHAWEQWNYGATKLGDYLDRIAAADLAVIVGEYGSFNVPGVDNPDTLPAAGFVMTEAVARGVGHVAWVWETGDANDLTDPAWVASGPVSAADAFGGAAWDIPNIWDATGGTLSIVGGRGRLTTPASGAYGGRAGARLRAPGAVGNLDMTMSFDSVTASEQYRAIMFHCTTPGTDFTRWGYKVRTNPQGNALTLYRSTDYVETSLANPGYTYTNGVRYFVQIVVTLAGTASQNIKVYVWNAGGSPPGSPQIDVNDDDHASGCIAIGLLNGGSGAAVSADVDDFTLTGTGAGTIPDSDGSGRWIDDLTNPTNLTILGQYAFWGDAQDPALRDVILDQASWEALYAFDETSGTFVDLSGNARTATATGSPIYGIPTPVGGVDRETGVHFKRGSGESCYAATPSSTAFVGKVGTWLAWVRVKAMDSSIQVWQGQSSDRVICSLELNANQSMDMRMGTSAGQIARSAVALTDVDRWHLVCWRASGTFSNGNVKLSVDGGTPLTLDATPTDRTVSASATTVRIGAAFAAGTGGEANKGGVLVKYAGFTTAYLSDADVTDIYTAGNLTTGNANTSDPGLLVGAHSDLMYMGDNYADPELHIAADANMRFLRHSWNPGNIFGDTTEDVGRDWTRLDNLLAEHASRSIGVMFNFTGMPRWTSGSPGAHQWVIPVTAGVVTSAYLTYVEDLVGEFVAHVETWKAANAPTLDIVYECPNEPNLDGGSTGFWDESDGGVPDPHNVVLVSNAVGAGVWGVDADLQLGLGCISGIAVGGGHVDGALMLDSIFADASLDTRFEDNLIVSWHCYPGARLPGTYEDYQNVLQLFPSKVLDIVTARGLTLVEQWCTEFNYNRASFSAANQAAHTGTALDRLDSYRGVYKLTRMTWWPLADHSDGTTNDAMYDPGAAVYGNYDAFAVRNTVRDWIAAHA